METYTKLDKLGEVSRRRYLLSIRPFRLKILFYLFLFVSFPHFCFERLREKEEELLFLLLLFGFFVPVLSIDI